MKGDDDGDYHHNNDDDDDYHHNNDDDDDYHHNNDEGKVMMIDLTSSPI